MEQLRTTIAYAKSVNVSTRSIDVVASSDTIDRHGDIIEQDWRLERYAKNPVVLFMHDHEQPVGRAENVRVEGGQLLATLILGKTVRAEEVWQLICDKVLRAVSVGFRPGQVVPDTTTPGRTIYRLKQCELFEISVVSVPSNPDALMKHKSLGLVPPNYRGSAVESIHETALRRAGTTDEERSTEAVREALVAGGFTLADLAAETFSGSHEDEVHKVALAAANRTDERGGDASADIVATALGRLS